MTLDNFHGVLKDNAFELTCHHCKTTVTAPPEVLLWMINTDFLGHETGKCSHEPTRELKILQEVGEEMEAQEDAYIPIALWALMTQLGHVASADHTTISLRKKLIELAATALRWAEKIKER